MNGRNGLWMGILGVAAVLGGVAQSGALGQCSFAWSEVQTTGAPGARQGAFVFLDPVRQGVVMLGGSTPVAVGGSFNSTETWALTGAAWSRLDVAPPPLRVSPAYCYDGGRGKVLQFGGQSSSGLRYSELNEWDGVAWSLRSVNEAPARSAAAMAFDSRRGVSVLFGGLGATLADALLADTWEWDGRSWSRAPVTGPSGRFNHAMAFDEARGEVVLFGGSTFSTPPADTWVYNGVEWRLACTSGPGHRSAPDMAYDPVRRAVVLSGGVGEWASTLPRGLGVGNAGGTTLLGDSWLWTGEAWRLISAASMPPRQHSAMAYSPEHNGLVRFGGRSRIEGNVAFADTRVLASSVVMEPAYEPRDMVVREGATVTVTLPVPANTPVMWRRGASTVRDGASPTGAVVSGATTPILSFSGVRRGDSGVFTALIGEGCGGWGATQLLVVLCPADFNEDEDMTPDDIADYVTDFFGGLTNRTDFNHDGRIDNDDLAEFIGSYFGPCR